MNEPLATSGKNTGSAVLPVSLPPAVQPKAIDLAVLKKGTKDFLEFVDGTKELCFGYLYHRTGSKKLSLTLLKEIYLSVEARAMSLWWFRRLDLKLLLDAADRELSLVKPEEADLDREWLPALAGFSPEEQKSVSSLHDALWTLAPEGQRVLILSLLLGLPDDRIGQLTGIRPTKIKNEVETAVKSLVSRWQPPESVLSKLQNLASSPALDIAQETDLRFQVVEKYNALRFRRYQWIIIGALFAVLSNVIVASVLAFAVVTQPPSSLRGSRKEVASFDALLYQREMKVAETRRLIYASFKETQKIAAYDATRNLTSLGLGAALQAFTAQQKTEAQVDRIIKLLERARTALGPLIDGPIFAVKAVLNSGT
ncbi:hypothetical protein A3A67_04645 [Candidatus Peribacteria bacterium RIFCSPLOWO2_01_FULL_51_18]|nr:MAG: hypothetical protein A3C52_00745 [Candidatus Peribacteria bacterium RIFCSPHIGHO2_02_FULL_51_15]OGJ66695.1 MAG: hypothetical protein A3A67_04645 [Candidatus Peribacteria bacterium RIFCSPLOWO2_01_FULL_51_18]OGJ69797.1 MAG: hypothetical protein A3J34_04965 [Candidatus Peribacteria bacterium RIFCSPLOWO2_02_FULL_51_10]